MKKIKISKTSWLIMAAGVFVLVLAGLGVTRSGQVKEQNSLTIDLAMSKTRLDKTDTSQLQVQDKELRQQLADYTPRLDMIKKLLRQPISSVAVTDKLFAIAANNSVNVTLMGTTAIARDNYGGIEFSVISVSAAAEGTLDNIIGFIESLNNEFATGYVQSCRFKVAGDNDAGLSNASIDLLVYSYEGD
jgi:hypothetical protein